MSGGRAQLARRIAWLLVRRVAWLLALSLATASVSGCCRILDLLPRPIEQDDDFDEDDLGDSPDGGGNKPRSPSIIDLGDAAYPDGNSASAVSHKWKTRNNLSPRKYRLGYQLDDRGEKNLEGDYHRWAKQLGYRKINKSRFQWRPPRRCFNGLHCVYEELSTQEDDAIEPLVTLFQKRIDEGNLDALQAASLVVTFGQEIKYRIPDEQPFGVMPPALVVERKNGDCDSKSLLAHMILRRLGIHSVLISSKAHAHTMLGIALPAPGTTFRFDGRRYAFTEMTAKRSPIGHINPKLLRPNDWRVDKMPYRVGKKPKSGKSKPRKPPEKGQRAVETPMNKRQGGPIRIERWR